MPARGWHSRAPPAKSTLFPRSSRKPAPRRPSTPGDQSPGYANTPHEWGFKTFPEPDLSGVLRSVGIDARAGRAGTRSSRNAHPLRTSSSHKGTKKTSDEEFRIQRTRDQRNRDQSQNSWTHNHPKTDAAAAEVRGVTVANGAARAPLRVPATPAAQHAGNVVRSIALFPAIIRLVGVSEVCVLSVAPQTTRPFKHVSRHVQAAIRTCPLRKTTHGARMANASFYSVGLACIKLITPRIDAPIRPPCRFLPFGFTG